jgi:uncharacterized iron-regulated membrane protein
MTTDGTTVVLWFVAATCAGVVAAVSLVGGDWFAAMGWAVGAAGSVGAAGQSSRLVSYRRNVFGPRHLWGPAETPWHDGGDPRWDDDPDDGAPTDWRGPPS